MELKPIYKTREVDYDKTLAALTEVGDFCVIPTSNMDISLIRTAVCRRFPDNVFQVNKTINGARITRNKA